VSDYDAAFAEASSDKRSESPYDAVMKDIMAPTKATVVADSAPAVVKAGAKGNDLVASIPRQFGLTARYGMEGLANTAQLVTEPIRYLQDLVTPERDQNLSNLVAGTRRPPKSMPLGVLASQFADKLGLPKPEGSTERVVGDAARLMAGAGGMGGAARTAQALPGALGQAGAFMSANMPSQLASAAGAGLAGGASREAGGSPLQQGVLSLLGGVAGGMAPGAANLGTDLAKRAVKGGMNPADLDREISVILNRADVDYSQLPAGARKSLRSDLEGALKTGKEIDAAAVARLADFRLTKTTPTRGMIGLDPVQVTREQNLAKIAANTADDQLHGLPRIQNENNATLIQNLNDAGAKGGDPFTAGRAVIDSIAARDGALKSKVTGLYDAARAMPGGDTPLNRSTVVNSVYDALAKQNKMAYLPEDISNTLNSISAGQVSRGGKTFDVPFDAKALDNLLTDIATAQRGTKDGNIKAALSIARKAIDSTGLQPVKREFGGNQVVTQAGAKYLMDKDAEAGQFMEALNKARGAAKGRFAWQESAKPIEAALDGAQPDKFVQKFVIGGSLEDARAVAKNAPVSDVKNAILAHLKEKALSGAEDEVGKFSSSAYNKAMNQIGYRKLGLFFSPEEISGLKAAGRAASYMQHQPVGSAVNNSNSGALMVGKAVDALMGAAKAAPVVGPLAVQPIAGGLKSLDIAIRNKQAQNIAPALLKSAEDSAPAGSSLLLPAIAAGGSLAAPTSP
jgi:hypothetical protein